MRTSVVARRIFVSINDFSLLYLLHCYRINDPTIAEKPGQLDFRKFNKSKKSRATDAQRGQYRFEGASACNRSIRPSRTIRDNSRHRSEFDLDFRRVAGTETERRSVEDRRGFAAALIPANFPGIFRGVSRPWRFPSTFSSLIHIARNLFPCCASAVSRSRHCVLVVSRLFLAACLPRARPFRVRRSADRRNILNSS